MTSHRPALAAVLLAAVLAPSPAGAAGQDALDDLARSASCLIEAKRIVTLSSQVQGTLSEVSVRRGDRVTRGTVVARLESSVEEAQLDGLRLRAETDVVVAGKLVEVEAAEAKLERQTALGKKDFASTQQIQEARSDLAIVKAQLGQAQLEQELVRIEVRRAEASLERRLIRTPVSGVVTAVHLDPGEFADPQKPAIEIAETETLSVEVYLPLEAYPLVAVGRKARVRPQAPIGGDYLAAIVSKDGQIDSASGLFQIQLELPNPEGAVPGGLRCEVEFVADG